MLTILTFIITTAYLLQTWGIEYGDPVYSVIILLACVPGLLADHQVIKEIMQKCDTCHNKKPCNGYGKRL